MARARSAIAPATLGTLNASVAWTVAAWAKGLDEPPARPSARERAIGPSPTLQPTLRIEGNPIGQSPAALDVALRGAIRTAPTSRSADRLLTWSGSLGEQLFAPDPRTWMAAGWRAFEALCDQLGPTLGTLGWTLSFQPHARHVLSDAKGCREFLARRSGQPFEVALAPATMLELSMLPRLEDHLVRMFEALGPVAALVVLEDVQMDADEDGLPRRTALGGGRLPRDLVLSLLREHVPERTPVMLRQERLPEQLAWLT